MSAYAKEDPNAKINRVYFYMVESNHTLVEYFIRSFTDIPWSAMPKFIDEIAQEIDEGAIPPSTSVQRDRKWKKRSYFVYYDRTAQLNKVNPVTFTGDKTCFLDGANVARSDGMIYAFYCINHMRKNGVDQKPGESQKFSVNVNHPDRSRLNHEQKEAGDASERVREADRRFTHDDSGTNTGPPK